MMTERTQYREHEIGVVYATFLFFLYFLFKVDNMRLYTLCFPLACSGRGGPVDVAYISLFPSAPSFPATRTIA